MILVLVLALPPTSLPPPLLICLFWLLTVRSFLAFDLFVTVLKHVRGHPSGPKISRSHPDCLLVTSSGRDIRLLTCTFILLARTGRCAAFMSAK